MSKRRATVLNKRDANEPEILEALGKCGVTWCEAGPLDGWIYLREWIPVEIKMPGEPFTGGQETFIAACVSDHMPVAVWRSVDDMLETINTRSTA